MNRLLQLTVSLVLTLGTAAAQDARSVLEAAAEAIGADNLHSIEFSGSSQWHRQ